MSALHPFHVTCREVVELVSEYLEHKLAPEDRIRFEQHLLTCPPCTLHLGQVQTTLELVGELEDASPPPPAATLDVFRRWKSS